MTEEEKMQIVAEVMARINAKAHAVSSLPEERDLESVVSLPAVKKDGSERKVVSVPIGVLRQPAEDAAVAMGTMMDELDGVKGSAEGLVADLGEAIADCKAATEEAKDLDTIEKIDFLLDAILGDNRTIIDDLDFILG